MVLACYQKMSGQVESRQEEVRQQIYCQTVVTPAEESQVRKQYESKIITPIISQDQVVDPGQITRQEDTDMVSAKEPDQ